MYMDANVLQGGIFPDVAVADIQNRSKMTRMGVNAIRLSGIQ